MNMSWSGGEDNGCLFQESRSKASSFTSFTTRNPKYCLNTHSSEFSLNMQSQLFSDIQLKGSILITQLSSKEMSKTESWTKGKEREDTERNKPRGRAGRQRQKTWAKIQNTKWSQWLRPVLLFTIAYDFSCGLVIHDLYDVEVCSLYTQFLYSSDHEKNFGFSQSLFLHLSRWSWLLYFIICSCWTIVASLE